MKISTRPSGALKVTGVAVACFVLAALAAAAGTRLMLNDAVQPVPIAPPVADSEL